MSQSYAISSLIITLLISHCSPAFIPSGTLPGSQAGLSLPFAMVSELKKLGVYALWHQQMVT